VGPVRDEDGQVVAIVAGLLLVGGAAIWAVAWLGAGAVERARAQTAADAAALAAAAGSDADAKELAAANGFTVQEIRRQGDDAEVVVPVGGDVAVARARRHETVVAATGARRGLAPAMLAALARAEELLSRPVPISSGYRSPESQRRLWEARASNPYPVARPGTSRHELGLAVDVPRGFAPLLAAVGADAGLCRPLPRTDPVHFELCPIR